MKKIEFTEDEKLQIIIYYEEGKSCEEIGVIYNVSLQTISRLLKSLGIDTMSMAKIGDIINGWKIEEIFLKNIGSQQVRMAKIVSTIDSKTRETRLSILTNKRIGWPDRRRPDLSIKNKTHGESTSRLYGIWGGMIQRCTNPKQYNYTKYGAKGIKICEEWIKYENFRDWANSNGYSDELSLDRKDVNGNYEPSNCKWSNKYEQAGNKSYSNKINITAFGETKNIYEWFNDPRCSLKHINGLRHRIHAGWEPEKAITFKSERSQSKPTNMNKWLQEHHPEILAEFANS